MGAMLAPWTLPSGIVNYTVNIHQALKMCVNLLLSNCFVCDWFAVNTTITHNSVVFAVDMKVIHVYYYCRSTIYELSWSLGFLLALKQFHSNAAKSLNTAKTSTLANNFFHRGPGSRGSSFCWVSVYFDSCGFYSVLSALFFGNSGNMQLTELQLNAPEEYG